MIPLKLKFKARQLESAKNLIRLQSCVNTKLFKKGDVVYNEGDIGDSIYFVDENIGGMSSRVCYACVRIWLEFGCYEF